MPFATTKGESDNSFRVNHDSVVSIHTLAGDERKYTKNE
jgi:hypothetical protein